VRVRRLITQTVGHDSRTLTTTSEIRGTVDLSNFLICIVGSFPSRFSNRFAKVRARPVTEQIGGGCIKSRNVGREVLDVSLATLVGNPSNPAVRRCAKRPPDISRDQVLQFAKQLGLVKVQQGWHGRCHFAYRVLKRSSHLETKERDMRSRRSRIKLIALASRLLS